MGQLYNPLIQSHVGAWEVAFVLLIIGYVLYRLDKQKIAKVIQMILRLMYVIIAVSGIWMLLAFRTDDPLYYIKGLLGIATISLAEMAMVRASKQRPSLGFLIGCLVLFVVVILIGYRVIV
ncbi:YisL family protein [Brevibacillus humidisoli]|uniref:YisL family protein n=1 Tax=Brevibacillus humidisoli TaxID=2895522 RepID=UPI001E41EB6C|nr:YisL family protein [Brevibacillus humidisoli]UFJ39551.1 YisL family protein [Brevibacillus humidisoli]